MVFIVACELEVDNRVGVEVELEPALWMLSKGFRSRPSGAAFGVSWSMGVEGQNLSICADLKTAELMDAANVEL